MDPFDFGHFSSRWYVTEAQQEPGIYKNNILEKDSAASHAVLMEKKITNLFHIISYSEFDFIRKSLFLIP